MMRRDAPALKNGPCQYCSVFGVRRSGCGKRSVWNSGGLLGTLVGLLCVALTRLLLGARYDRVDAQGMEVNLSFELVWKHIFIDGLTRAFKAKHSALKSENPAG